MLMKYSCKVKDCETFLFFCIILRHKIITLEILANVMSKTKNYVIFHVSTRTIFWSQWPRGLRRRSAAPRLLRSWVRIPPGTWSFVCCECCVLSGRGLCDELITRPEESYRVWCVVVCDLKNLKNEVAMIRVGSQRHRKN